MGSQPLEASDVTDERREHVTQFVQCVIAIGHAIAARIGHCLQIDFPNVIYSGRTR